MSRFETMLTVARDIERTFDFVSDLRHAPLWDPLSSEAWKVSEGRIDVRSSFLIVTHVGLVDLVQPYEVTVYNRPFRIAFRGQTRMTRYEEDISFSSVRQGTEIEYVADVWLTGVFWVGSPIMPFLARLIGASATRGLKYAIECAIPSERPRAPRRRPRSARRPPESSSKK